MSRIQSPSLRTVMKMLLGALALAWVAGASSADAQTLNEIKQRGKIIIGVQAENPPWGYVDTNGQLAGFDIDVAKLVGREIGLPVEFVRVTTPNRIAQLQTGKVDVLIAVVGMYPDRAKAIQFSKPYATLQNVVVAPKSVNIKDYADFSGKRIGVARGTSMDVAFQDKAPKDTTIQRFDDDPAAIQALLSGQVDGIGGNSTYLPNILKVNPNAQVENKFVMFTQWQGFGLRQGDKEFLRWCNATIDKLTKSGELNAINQKWLAQDLPPFPKEIPGVPFADD